MDRRMVSAARFELRRDEQTRASRWSNLSERRLQSIWSDGLLQLEPTTRSGVTVRQQTLMQIDVLSFVRKIRLAVGSIHHKRARKLMR